MAVHTSHPFSGMGPGAAKEGEWVQILCPPLAAPVTLLSVRTSALDAFLLRAGMAQLLRSGDSLARDSVGALSAGG